MNDEPKSAAELKETRLKRKLAQDAEGIKAMADIAAADIAIRKRTANLRAMRLAKEAADRDKAPEPKIKVNARKSSRKKATEMAKDDRGRADARFNRPGAAKTTKSEYDIAAKAVLDNMAKLKALR